MFRQTQALQTMFNAVEVDGVSTSLSVDQYRHLILELATSGSAELRIRFKCSVSDTCPDFSAAASPTNCWSYIQVDDTQDGSPITGNEGILFEATDACMVMEINNNGAKWVAAEISDYTAGALTLKLKVYGD